MPIPTYRPRSISFFLAPYRDARADLTPDPYDPRTSGIRPGTFAYPSPDAGAPLVQTTNYSVDAGAASSGGDMATKDQIGIRIPFAAAGAVSTGLAGAALGSSLAKKSKVAGALVGGVLGAAAGGAATWWVVAAVQKSIAPDFAPPPAEAGAPDYAKLNLAGYADQPAKLRVVGMTYDPNAGNQWPGAPAPPPPGAAPPKPGAIAPVTGDASTASSVDAKSSDAGGSSVPWGWIVGGGIAAIVVVGGVALVASSPKRRRRARGR